MVEPYSGSPHPPRVAESGGTIIRLGSDGRGAVHADTIWACTTCRACVNECPMMIEHVDAIVDLRRHQTLELGATPGKGAAALEELKAADNPGGRALGSRLDWAADLALCLLLAEMKTADVLLWLGDGAFDLRNQRTLRALVVASAPRQDRFRRAGRRRTRLRRSGAAAGRRGDVPGSRPAQHRDTGEIPLPPHRDGRSPCAALSEERISRHSADAMRSSITADCLADLLAGGSLPAAEALGRQHRPITTPAISAATTAKSPPRARSSIVLAWSGGRWSVRACAHPAAAGAAARR